MPSSQPTTRPLPDFVIIAASVLAMGHLLVIGLLALAAPSGIWLTNAGPAMVVGPQFATRIISQVTVPYYLHPLRLSNNYHFATNRPRNSSAYFEIILKDVAGDEKTLKYPDDKANFWVRHRQEMLFQGFEEPQMMEPLSAIQIEGEGQQAEMIEYWFHDPMNNRLDLKRELKRVAPRNVPLPTPSDWTKLRVQAYMRYLCQKHNAVSAKLVRHSKEVDPIALMPSLVLTARPNQEPAWDRIIVKLETRFGEYSREK